MNQRSIWYIVVCACMCNGYIFGVIKWLHYPSHQCLSRQRTQRVHASFFEGFFYMYIYLLCRHSEQPKEREKIRSNLNSLKTLSPKKPVFIRSKNFQKRVGSNAIVLVLMWGVRMYSPRVTHGTAKAQQTQVDTR